jgi:ATP-dependent Clp protease ATP-binding subunit ClpB
VDEVITFRALDEADFARIAAIQMNELKTALAERHIALSFTDAALALIAKASYSHKFGARNMRRFIQKNVEDALAEKIIADYARSITHASVTVKNKELRIEVM